MGLHWQFGYERTKVRQLGFFLRQTRQIALSQIDVTSTGLRIQGSELLKHVELHSKSKYLKKFHTVINGRCWRRFWGHGEEFLHTHLFRSEEFGMETDFLKNKTIFYEPTKNKRVWQLSASRPSVLEPAVQSLFDCTDGNRNLLDSVQLDLEDDGML